MFTKRRQEPTGGNLLLLPKYWAGSHASNERRRRYLPCGGRHGQRQVASADRPTKGCHRRRLAVGPASSAASPSPASPSTRTETGCAHSRSNSETGTWSSRSPPATGSPKPPRQPGGRADGSHRPNARTDREATVGEIGTRVVERRPELDHLRAPRGALN